MISICVRYVHTLGATHARLRQRLDFTFAGIQNKPWSSDLLHLVIREHRAQQYGQGKIGGIYSIYVGSLVFYFCFERFERGQSQVFLLPEKTVQNSKTIFLIIDVENVSN